MQAALLDGEACAQARSDSFPALQQLGLGVAELKILRQSGYLTQDQRGKQGAGYWRLRFRCSRKLRTVYLGRNEQLLAEVQHELAILRNQYRLQKQLRETVQLIRRSMRGSKQRLGAVLTSLGLHYHGDAIRRFRKVTNPI